MSSKKLCLITTEYGEITHILKEPDAKKLKKNDRMIFPVVGKYEIGDYYNYPEE